MIIQESLTFRSGEEIDQLEAGTGLLQKYWKAYGPKNVQEWCQRIRNAGRCIVGAYSGNDLVGILEAMKLDIGGNPDNIPATFHELTGGGTWNTHKVSGDTVVLVDLTIAPDYHGSGIFEAIVQYARKSLESPSGVILTYSPLFRADNRYWVIRKHERLGAKLLRELPGSRPGLTMTVAREEVPAEDVGITAYSL